jgi:biotin transporter BioY
VNKIIENIAAAIKVKTYVTVVLVTAYSSLVIRGEPIPDYFQNLMMIVIGFYFGTQFDAKNTVRTDNNACKNIQSKQ